MDMGGAERSPDEIGTLAASRLDAIRTLVLGIHAWAVVLFVPAVHAGASGATAIITLIAPLALLWLGVLALRRRDQPGMERAATWTLLAAYPFALAVVLALRPELAALDAFSTPVLVLAVIALVGYAAGAASATGRPRAVRSATRRPLGSVSPVPVDRRRVLGRRALLGVASVGALLLAVVAPTWGGRAEIERAFGRAAPEAALVAAVVGGALATVAIALFFGPTLRATRDRVPTRAQVRRRVTGYLLAVASGLAVYWILRRAG
jgi:hypothetical protein